MAQLGFEMETSWTKKPDESDLTTRMSSLPPTVKCLHIKIKLGVIYQIKWVSLENIFHYF